MQVSRIYFQYCCIPPRYHRSIHATTAPLLQGLPAVLIWGDRPTSESFFPCYANIKNHACFETHLWLNVMHLGGYSLLGALNSRSLCFSFVCFTQLICRWISKVFSCVQHRAGRTQHRTPYQHLNVIAAHGKLRTLRLIEPSLALTTHTHAFIGCMESWCRTSPNHSAPQINVIMKNLPRVKKYLLGWFCYVILSALLVF